MRGQMVPYDDVKESDSVLLQALQSNLEISYVETEHA